jgi:hypothetical protein
LLGIASSFLFCPFGHCAPCLFSFCCLIDLLWWQVGALVVKECVACFGIASPPALPALQSLPGFVRLRQFRDFTSTSGAGLGSFIITNTAMTNFTSFAGLTCPAGFFNIQNNVLLTSFSGLNLLAYPTFLPGVTFVAQGNPLTVPSTVSSISVMAGCPPGLTTSAQTSGVLILTTNCAIQVGPGPAIFVSQSTSSFCCHPVYFVRT